MVDADGVRATDRLIPMAESYFTVEENHFLEEPKFSGSDDYEWLQRLLQEESMVTTEASGPLGDSDDVVFVKQVKAKSMNSDKVDANDDDCVILDGDPNKVVSVDDGGSDDLHIVGEKGQIACRDYPHPRHLCLIFLFRSTSHANYCTQCHCYVCDSPAPCSNWDTGTLSTDHCHATDKEETWKTKRKMIKQKKSKPDVPHLPLPIRPDIQLPPWQPPAVTSFTAPDSNYQPAPYPRGNTVDSATIVLQNQTRGINHGNLRNYYSPKSPVFKKIATLSRSLTVPRNSNRITTHNVLRSMRGYNAVSDQAIVRRPNLGHHQSTAPPDKRSRNCIQPTNQHFQVMNLHKSLNQQTFVGNYWSSQSDPQAVRGGNNGFEDKFVGITVADIENWLLED